MNCPTAKNPRAAVTHHVSTAVQVLDAQTDVARVVHRGGVGELVRLEARDGRGFAGTVLEPVQDLGVRGATKGEAFFIRFV